MALDVMYRGINNSPKTTLSADITAVASTIIVANIAVFPPAPNLATIGAGNNAEVIRYNGTDGNKLTGCERGFSGTTASGWDEDTSISRFFTKYDHDTLIDNLTNVDTNKIDKVGNASTATVVPTTETSRQPIASGDTIAKMAGKISKWFADLQNVAFSGSYSDLSGKPHIQNSGTSLVERTIFDIKNGLIAVDDADNGKTTIKAHFASEANNIKSDGNTASAGSLDRVARADHIHLAEYTNDNLLDNWDFRNPVNQRRVTTWSSDYGIDRWSCNDVGGTVTVNPLSSLTINAVSASTDFYLEQKKEKTAQGYIGKTMTLSVMDESGTIFKSTGVLSETGYLQAFTNFHLYFAVYNELLYVRIIVLKGENLVLKTVKLELGSISTLVNDAPMPYTNELLKCQRYYVNFKKTGGGSSQPVQASFDETTKEIEFPVIMRIAPTVTIYDYYNTPNTYWVSASGSKTDGVVGVNDALSFRVLLPTNGLNNTNFKQFGYDADAEL